MKRMKAHACLTALVLAFFLGGYGKQQLPVSPAAKPVLYLYPQEETAVTVELDLNGELTASYPAYEEGWSVLARPDGTLTDPDTGREYYCLF